MTSSLPVVPLTQFSMTYCGLAELSADSCLYAIEVVIDGMRDRIVANIPPDRHVGDPWRLPFTVQDLSRTSSITLQTSLWLPAPFDISFFAKTARRTQVATQEPSNEELIPPNTWVHEQFPIPAICSSPPQPGQFYDIHVTRD